jgi:hypothetical protein
MDELGAVGNDRPFFMFNNHPAASKPSGIDRIANASDQIDRCSKPTLDR